MNLTTEERRRRSMLQPNCAHCPNKARMGSPYCGACARIVERAREAADLTAEFRAIERAADLGAEAHREDEAVTAHLYALVSRLAAAMAQAREAE